MMTKNSGSLLACLCAPLLALASTSAHAEWALNMPRGVTDISRRIYDLHMIMLWICVVIGVLVFGVMIYSIVHFRKSRGAVPDTRFVHSTRMEIVWTTIPVLILIGSAIPAARTLIETENATNTELTIRVTGYQWKWGYDYVDAGISVLSTLDSASNEARQLGSGIDPNSVPDYLLNVDHPLVVPADTKVRLLLSAQDVIHAWWVPALAVKKDAVPGFINELWFKVDADKTGVYRGQCAELCGRDHGFMPIVVDVKSKAEFAQWLEVQKAANQPAAAPAEATAAPQAG